MDLLLDPLKSELNWPMGAKRAIDLIEPSALPKPGAQQRPATFWRVSAMAIVCGVFISICDYLWFIILVLIFTDSS